MTNRSIFTFILECLAPFRLLIAGQFVVGIVWAIDLSLRPYLVKIMLNSIVDLDPSQAFAVLTKPALFYIFMSALVTVIFRFYEYIWLKLNSPLRKSIVLKIMDRMMDHSHHTFQNYFAGSLGNKIKDVMSGIPSILQLLVDRFFSHFLALVIAVYTLALASPKFALIFSIWAIIYLYGSYRASITAQKLSDIASEKSSTVVGNIVDVLGNIASVRLFSAKKYERQSLGVTLQHYVNANQQKDWYFLKFFTFQGFSFVIYQAISFYLLITGLQNQTVSPGDFALVLMINISIIGCLWDLTRDFGNFAESLGEVSQGLNIALQEVEIADKPDAKDLAVTRGEIVFKNVQFHYRGSKPLFNDLSVTIPAGQKVGLVGYSGSGKSSFVNLILRLFDTTSGQILIDGQDVRSVTQSSLRQEIGMIPQDPALFHRSLIENIRYSRSSASDAEVMEAAKAAYAHKFIEKLSEGYNALVGERGVKLSGGQRQRIAIARGFLKNAPILMLDEATSQLDSVTENYIQEALLKLIEGKTALVIAHRLSTLLHMDRILVFNQGGIVEDGTHDELVAMNGFYKKLWDAQVGGFLPDK